MCFADLHDVVVVKKGRFHYMYISELVSDFHTRIRESMPHITPNSLVKVPTYVVPTSSAPPLAPSCAMRDSHLQSGDILLYVCKSCLWVVSAGGVNGLSHDVQVVFRKHGRCVVDALSGAVEGWRIEIYCSANRDGSGSGKKQGKTMALVLQGMTHNTRLRAA